MADLTRRQTIATGAAALATSTFPAVAGEHPDAAILAAWREWQRVGAIDYGDDDAMGDRLGAERHAARQTIVDTPAFTLEGIVAKLRVVGMFMDAAGPQGLEAFVSIIVDARRAGVVETLSPLTSGEESPGVEAMFHG